MADNPLTDSLSSDILLLSTFLNGRKNSSVESSPVDVNLDLFIDISTLLAITSGNNQQNAVLGKATSTAMDFLVCVESTSMEDTGISYNQSGMSGSDNPIDDSRKSPGGLVRIMPKKENGKHLLAQWDPEILDEEVVDLVCHFSFDSHLRDLFDVIIALNPDDLSDLLRFQLFIHHRAYFQLSRRVLEFSTHWGEGPFDILLKHLDPELGPKTFQFKHQDEDFHNLIQVYVTPEPSSSSDQTTLGPVYSVNAGNASQWLLALQELWAHLERHLLVHDDNTMRKVIREDPPNSQMVESVVALMFIFEALRPVIKHLLSTEGAAHALAMAEMKNISRPKGSGRNAGPSVMSQSDGYDMELVLTRNDLSQLPQKSVDHVLRALKSVLAWHTSCRHIFGKARQFQSFELEWRLSQFRYHDYSLKPFAFDVKTVSPLLQAWQGTPNNPRVNEDALCLIQGTSDAKVHAEAALMHWIATVKDIDSSQNWPIGSSRKSCQLCWLLHQIYNAKRSSKFLLSGTHGTFLPWVPPPGLPDSILVELRKALLSACKTISTHTKQSSASSITSDIALPKFSRFSQAFARMRRPTTQD